MSSSSSGFPAEAISSPSAFMRPMYSAMVAVPFLVVERAIRVLTMLACVWERNISLMAVHAAAALVQWATWIITGGEIELKMKLSTCESCARVTTYAGFGTSVGLPSLSASLGSGNG